MKFIGKVVNEFARRLCEDEKLALVRLAVEVALEAVGVATRLGAHLAVPAQLLQAFRFDTI